MTHCYDSIHFNHKMLYQTVPTYVHVAYDERTLKEFSLKNYMLRFFYRQILHEDYDTTTLNLDFAVITLETEIDFSLIANVHIRPICPPTKDYDVDEEVIKTSWGR